MRSQLLVCPIKIPQQLNIAGQAKGGSTLFISMSPNVTYQECRCSEELEGQLASVCHSDQLPSRCPDRNSISWQDMYVMHQPANLIPQQVDARRVVLTHLTVTSVFLHPA